ncbi:uncharacterized mitochondrial protein AtMg00310-like [Arachis duranensis]|uniref:Uncharacterized mitochondrial protein AtMg00310-like n=1 Tax=Arachis duranensis TaxID=130453 RepID=A0A9C6TCJ2_ARADU|nr:uncharacterized mitochondrial protein AtMg00310-like [Arachis duranensis]
MGWKRSLLSSCGRHTLLRTIGEAIPIYTLSCFKLPNTLLTEIHSMFSQFWWGKKGAERKMVWIKWDTMTIPKKDGGYTDFLHAEIGSIPSWGWRSVLEGRKVIEKGLLWKIGSGANVRIFHDLWLPPPLSFNFPQAAVTIPPNLQVYYVSALLNSDRNWNRNLIDSFFLVDI